MVDSSQLRVHLARLLKIATFGVGIALHGFLSCFLVSCFILAVMHHFPYCDSQKLAQCEDLPSLLTRSYGIKLIFWTVVGNPAIALWPLVGMLCATSDWKNVFPRWVLVLSAFNGIVLQNCLSALFFIHPEAENPVYGQVIYFATIFIECYYYACYLARQSTSQELSRKRVILIVIAGILLPYVGSVIFQFAVFPYTLELERSSMIGFLVCGFSIPVVSVGAQTFLRFQGYEMTYWRYYTDLFSDGDGSVSSTKSLNSVRNTQAPRALTKSTTWFAQITLTQILYSCAQRVLNSGNRSAIGLTWLSGFLSLLGVLSIAFNDSVAGARIYRQKSRKGLSSINKRESLGVVVLNTGKAFYGTTHRGWATLLSTSPPSNEVRDRERAVGGSGITSIAPLPTDEKKGKPEEGPATEQQPQEEEGGKISGHQQAGIRVIRKSAEMVDEEATRRVRTIFTIWIYTAYGAMASSFLAIGVSNGAKMMAKVMLNMDQMARWTQKTALEEEAGPSPSPLIASELSSTSSRSFGFYLYEALSHESVLSNTAQQFFLEVLINLTQNGTLFCALQWINVPILETWSLFVLCRRNMALLFFTVLLAGSYFVPYALWYLCQILL